MCSKASGDGAAPPFSSTKTTTTARIDSGESHLRLFLCFLLLVKQTTAHSDATLNDCGEHCGCELTHAYRIPVKVIMWNSFLWSWEKEKKHHHCLKRVGKKLRKSSYCLIVDPQLLFRTCRHERYSCLYVPALSCTLDKQNLKWFNDGFLVAMVTFSCVLLVYWTQLTNKIKGNITLVCFLVTEWLMWK